jgi:hypothetical protein
MDGALKSYLDLRIPELQQKFGLTDTESHGIVQAILQRAKGKHTCPGIRSAIYPEFIGMFLFAHLVMEILKSQPTKVLFHRELEPNVFPDGLGQA